MVALRKDRAQLHFDEDGKKYWFKLSEARQWRVEPLRDSEVEAEAEVEVEAVVEAVVVEEPLEADDISTDDISGSSG